MMGRLIQIGQPETENDWVLPLDLRQYDRRSPTWPNELFPFVLEILDHDVQGEPKVLIRRCIEQECQGDVAMERSYSPLSLTWNLWFQLLPDKYLVSNQLLEITQKRNNT